MPKRAAQMEDNLITINTKYHSFEGCVGGSPREIIRDEAATVGSTRAEGLAMEQRGSGGNRMLTRRAFLTFAGAGIAVAAGMPTAALAEIASKRFSHEGAKVEIASKKKGGGLELYIDGRRVEVVDSNGAYRAAGFMYSPQPTPEGLAKRLVDNRARLARRI
jgi:hypothetical protein